MKKWLFLAAFFGFFSGASAISVGVSAEKSPAATPDRSLFQTISAIQNARQLLLEKKIELRQEENRVFPESTEIDKLSAKKAALKNELSKLEKTEKPNSKKLAEKKAEFEKVAFQLNEKSKIFHDNFEIHRKKIAEIQKEIADTEAEIAKLTEIAKNQAEDLAVNIGIFLGFIALIFLLRYVSAKMIRRLSGKIPIAREKTLLRINKIIFNILIGISFLIAVFSQFASILPFLAILGTALAFALRDIISSFIAWFVIGTTSGYKIGDLIEIRGVRGRVIEIHPLLTVLRQTGMRGDTGRILSIPNKLIFEGAVHNFSKMYRFTFLMIDFFLEPDSDIDLAKRFLREAIFEAASRDLDEAEKNLPNLQSKFGISPDLIEPKIYIEPDPRGVFLRGKFICRLQNRHAMRSGVAEHFYKKVRESGGAVKIRVVEIGNFSEHF